MFTLLASVRAALRGPGGLAAAELKMFQDPGGWQYVTVSDTDAGIQTQHTCFDGQPHPDVCSGRLTFTTASTFVQRMHIHGQLIQRHGTSELDGNQLSFLDELGTKDGPYTLTIYTQTKRLILEMAQVRMELELESQYHKDMQARKQRR